uniref:THAP-type domain-containing protein n=1 Tax=Pundamilia nyererei TaxID=303518 RepID=A0A3B4HCF7_9CICH
MAWIAAIRRPNITFENTPPHMLVCSKHFHKGKCFVVVNTSYIALNRNHRAMLLFTTKTTAEIQPQQITPQHEDEDLQDCKMCSLRLQEVAHLQGENLILKKGLSKQKLDTEFLKDNNSKVKFYTGLPSFALLMGVLQQISPSLPDTGRKISHFQMLLLTLMCLRLNLPIAHIAHLFDISRTTTSTVFNITVNVLYAHLSPLVHWPGRHCIQASMPHQYVEMFGDRVTVIIDSFELFIERAAAPATRPRIKHTMKYLIGITPQGTISFISKGWGGLLADRGFDIKESVALMGATLKIPAFTRGRSQLQAKDVEDTRKLAHVWIHVERVIGCLLSKYTVLNDTIHLGFVVPCEGENMTLLDKIVAVSCALTNMCPSVVVKQASDE